MIVTERRYDDDINLVNTSNAVVPADTDEVRDENGMTRDDRFDQLEDESRVVTSGSGSTIGVSSTSDGTRTTGYSAGVGSGISE